MHLKVDENYGLIPINDEGITYLYRRKVGDVLKCEVSQERNLGYHKKLFSLFKTVHDALPDPEPIMFRGEMLQPQKTLDMTRKWLTVQAGFYDVFATPKGEIRVEAKSLKFNKMSPEDFDELYSKIIDVSLKVLPSSWSEEELERVALQIINYV